MPQPEVAVGWWAASQTPLAPRRVHGPCDVHVRSAKTSVPPTRLGKGGGFADLEFALASAAGLIGPATLVVTTVHELQVRDAGVVPTGAHDAPVDLMSPPSA